MTKPHEAIEAELQAEVDTWLRPQACKISREEPYDFAQCETHDRTFPRGGRCDHEGMSELAWLNEREGEQRARAVRAEMERDAAQDEVADAQSSASKLRARLQAIADECVGLVLEDESNATAKHIGNLLDEALAAETEGS